MPKRTAGSRHVSLELTGGLLEAMVRGEAQRGMGRSEFARRALAAYASYPITEDEARPIGSRPAVFTGATRKERVAASSSFKKLFLDNLGRLPPELQEQARALLAPRR